MLIITIKSIHDLYGTFKRLSIDQNINNMILSLSRFYIKICECVCHMRYSRQLVYFRVILEQYRHIA